jgi:hypothetical protein
VGDGLDLRGIDVVDVLSGGVGLVVPGVVENAPTGPACRSASTRPGHPSFIMGVDPNHGLDEVYQRRADHRLFQPGTVGGFPAVETVDGPPCENEVCLVQVGVADNGLVIVAVGPADVTQSGPTRAGKPTAWPRRSSDSSRRALPERARRPSRGEVVEIGAGHGGNFPHYPRTVTRVLAVEPEPRLCAIARAAAADGPVPIEVTDGLADHLPAAGHSMDAAVFCLVLCSVPDPAAALREARRILTPAGQLRVLEHVRADHQGLARVQRLMDATVWPVLAGAGGWLAYLPRHGRGDRANRLH